LKLPERLRVNWSVQPNEGVHTALCDSGGVLARSRMGMISDCFSGFKFVCAELEEAEGKIRRKLV
jgi:hypothetical protein